MLSRSQAAALPMMCAVASQMRFATTKELPAFFVFAGEKRPEVVAELGNNIGQVGKRMGELWAAVSPAEKSRYDDFAQECNRGGNFRTKKTRMAVAKPEGYPKRALLPFFIFMGENRTKIAAANPTLSLGPLVKKMSEIFKALPADEAERYIALAKADKERYETEMATYLANGGVKVTSSGEVMKVKVVSAKPEGYPQRALLPFFIFTEENRAKIAAANPTLAAAPLAKKMREIFKALPADEAERYIALAKADKERYETEMAKYLANGGVKVTSSGKAVKVKKAKDPNMPKRALIPFFIFMGENRTKIAAANPTLSLGPLVKKMSEIFKALPADEAERYISLAKADKERYTTEMAKYLANGGVKVTNNGMEDRTSTIASSYPAVQVQR